jgi:hypothetical protein
VADLKAAMLSLQTALEGVNHVKSTA